MKLARYFLLFLTMCYSLISNSQSAFYNLGKNYAEEGNYDEAIGLTYQSVQIDCNSSDKYNLLLDYNALCKYYSYKTQSDSCQKYAQLTIDLSKKVDRVDYSDILRNLSHHLHRAGLYQQAVDHRKEIVRIIIDRYGVNTPQLLSEYRILSCYCRDMDDKKNAVEYAKREEHLAYLIRSENSVSGDVISFEDSFGWLRLIIQDCEDPIEGINYLLKCLHEQNDVIDIDNRRHTLNTIWAMSRDNDFLEGCIAVYKERILNGSIQEKFENFINLVAEGNNFSNDVHASEYPAALYSHAINNELPNLFSNEDITALLGALTYYYSETGPDLNYYNIAKLNYEWRLKHRLDIGLSDMWVLVAASSIAGATQYIISLAEEILMDHRHDDDQEVLKYVNESLAHSYLKLGDKDRANYYFSNMGSPDDFDVLYSKASAFIKQGDIKELFPVAEKLIKFNNLSPELRELVLSWLMLSARDNRKKDIVTKYAEEFVGFHRAMIINELPLMSEKEQTHFLRTNPRYSHIPFYDLLIGINNNTIDWSASQEAYDYALLSKGVLLTSQNEFRDAIRNCPDSALIANWSSLQKSSASFALQDEIIKRELIKYASQTTSYFKKLSYRWYDVRNALRDDEAAIEFVKCYNFYNFTDITSNPYYIALVIRREYDQPQTVVLGPAALIDGFNNDELLHRNNTNIFETLWKPIQQYVSDIKNIYFSPCEELNSIAIEYASMVNNKRVCDQWNLFRLSSTREIIDRYNSPLSLNAVLFGGLKYDLEREEMIAESRSGDYHPTSTHRAVMSNNLRYGVRDLPGTIKEVDKIFKLFPSSYKPKMIMSASGTEESFKRLTYSKFDIIHLATHGFFWSEREAENRKYVNFIKAAQLQSSNFEDNAMTRSGLLFSGANLALKGETLPDDVEDGVLTALELSNMNLGNVDMVVMSACESGLGETSGEGVFGLQRGFKLAGAKTLLMSLWKVDDEATQLLMTEFYRHYLSGKSKNESLKLAQKSLRDHPEFSDPEYWAAFVLLDGLN